MDDAPFKPRETDASQQTLDTRSPSLAPEISLPDQSRPPAPSSPSALAPGEIIAKRFRIERFIAQGGMGEVYEALDIELKQKVALKTVRSVLLGDVQSLERFRQEIVVAKRVTHPNVCRTYDLFRHEPGKPGESDILVVSMEFLAGQTLDHLLKQKGKLSPAEALPLLRQMVAGLSAAHHAGVVHRDFKSSNVLLIPPSSGSAQVRVVVSDFGLAHSLDPGEFALTRTGEMLGTPAYMAPEQVTGKAISPATDIYSLGVVLFEMLTGRLPFTGKNWREVAFQRLESVAPSPKSLVPDLEDSWSRTIQKCLEREPADRFQTVDDVEKALAGEAETLLRHEVTLRQRRKRVLLAALGLVAVAAIGLVVGVAFPNLFFAHRSPTVAVLGFKNLSGDSALDPWGSQFRTNLGTSLDVTQIRYMSPQNIEPVWKYQNASDLPEEPSAEALAKLNKMGCRYVVFGTYTVEGSSPHRKILWNIRLVDSGTGQSLGSITKSPTEDDRLDVVTTVGAELRGKLGVSLTPSERHSADRALPINEEASRAYDEGMTALLNFQYSKAKDSFLAAVQADPGNAEIRSALAESWWELGYELKARDEAKRAADLAGSLSGDKNSLIRARYYGYSGKWDDAATLYASLWNINQDRPAYALLLAKSLSEAKRYSEALAALQKLQQSKIVEPILNAEIQLQLAELQERLGNNSQRLLAATSAVEIARALDAGLLQARAEIAQCQALLDLGKVAEASPVCTHAEELNKQQGDDLGTARAQNGVANIYFNHGDINRAEPLYTEALAIATRIGDKRDEAGALLNLGNIQNGRNDFSAAKEFYQRSIQVSTERTGINNDLLLAKQGLAVALGATGDLPQAIQILHQVVDEARPNGDKLNLSAALMNLCGNLLITGNVPEAKSSCEESLQLLTETGDKTGQARAQQSLADVLVAADELPDAERFYQLALRAQQELGAKTDAAYTQASLAELRVNRGDFSAAEKFAEPALEAFLREKDAAGEVSVRCTLAQAFLGMGRQKDAEGQIRKAAEHLPEIQDPALRATLSIQQAVVRYSSKPSEPAVSELKKIESEMRKADLLQLALEARLARAKILAGSARKAELKSFGEEAAQHGYLLLARKAAAAAGA